MYRYDFHFSTPELLSNEKLENIIYYLKDIGESVNWDVHSTWTVMNEPEIPY